MTADDVLAALNDLRQGRVRLSPEEQLIFLDAVEELVRVVIAAPRGGDMTQLAIWNVHERVPALARLADAARPGKPSLAKEIEEARADEARLVREMRAMLGMRQ